MLRGWSGSIRAAVPKRAPGLVGPELYEFSHFSDRALPFSSRTTREHPVSTRRGTILFGTRSELLKLYTLHTHFLTHTNKTAFFFRKSPTSCCVLRIKGNSYVVRQKVTDYFTYPFGTVSGKRISGIMKTSSFSLRVMRRVSYLLDVVLL